MYRTLDYEKILATIAQLQARIADRFPDSGLRQVCAEVQVIAEDGRRRVEWIAKPDWLLRVSVAIFIVLALLGFVYSVSSLELSLHGLSVADLVQAAEAVLNEVVLIGAAIFFLVSIESRIKRYRALAALHELRAIAHVVDMHQLTKDPAMLGQYVIVSNQSPPRGMTAFELKRYLDYCSELLALIGKLAALYSQQLPDAIVVSAANDIEDLCTALSRKIWQKITLIPQAS